jgi:hypothetical protein
VAAAASDTMAEQAVFALTFHAMGSERPAA